jgi:hypothetical protein
MNNNICKFTFLLLIILLISMPLHAQTPPKDYPFEFEYARKLEIIGEYEKAIQKYREVQLANPGTKIAIRCQQRIAPLYVEMGKKEEALQECRDIINNYPGTSAVFGAKGRIIDISYIGTDFNTWLQKSDELIIEYGGISYKEILRGNIDFDSRTRIPQYLRQNIANSYSVIASCISDQRFLSKEKRRYDDSIKIYQFIRENFPDYEVDVTELMLYSIYDKNDMIDRTYFPEDNKPPTIRPIAPHECLEIGEDKQKIEVELEDGDISQYQVNIHKTIFTLDGNDLTKDMKVKSTINTNVRICSTPENPHNSNCREPRCGHSAYKEGPTFEKLRLTYYLPCGHPTIKVHGHSQDHPPCSHCGHRHCTSLSPGWHTVYIKAFDNGGRASEKTWRFFVKR